MATPQVINEPSILFVSRVYCLLSSDSCQNYNWLWKVSPSLHSSKKGTLPDIGQLIRLLDVVHHRCKTLGVTSVAVDSNSIFEGSSPISFKWNQGIEVLSKSALYSRLKSTVSDGLDALSACSAGKTWQNILTRDATCSDIARAAAVIAGLTFPSPLSDPIDATVQAAIAIVKGRNFGWFQQLYGQVSEVLGVVTFVASPFNNDPSIDNIVFSGLPLILTRQGIVGLFGTMEYAVLFANSLNHDVHGDRNSALWNRLFKKTTKRSHRISAIRAKIDMFSIVNTPLTKEKRHCLARKKMGFYSVIKHGFWYRLSLMIDRFIAPVISLFAAVVSAMGWFKYEMLTDTTISIGRHLTLVDNILHPNQTVWVVGVVWIVCTMIFILTIIRLVKIANVFFRGLRIGRLKPGWWEHILLFFDGDRHLGWLPQEK